MLIGRGIPHPEATGFVDTCEIDNPRMADQVLTLFRYEQQKPVWASLQTRHKGSDVDTLCIGPEVVDAHLLRVRQLRAKRSNLHGTSGFYCQRLDLWARGHELGPVPGRGGYGFCAAVPGDAGTALLCIDMQTLFAERAGWHVRGWDGGTPPEPNWLRSGE